LVSEHILPLRIEHDGPDPFWLKATLAMLGPITLGELRGCAHRVTRLTPPARRSPAEAGHGKILVNLQMNGNGTARGPGESLQVGDGVTGILAADWPELIELPNDFHQLVLMLPADLLPAAVRTRTLAGSERLARSPAAVGLLANTVDYVLQHVGELDRSTARVACEHVLELLALSFAGDDPHAAHRDSDVLRRIDEQIERRLHEPELRTVDVAQALGVSARYVQQVLARQGTTFTRLVTERRLLLCRIAFDTDPGRMLGTARIARRYGFVNSAHFSRVFTRHVGISPRAYRVTASGARSAAGVAGG